jgi:hypothetical protein
VSQRPVPLSLYLSLSFLSLVSVSLSLASRLLRHCRRTHSKRKQKDGIVVSLPGRDLIEQMASSMTAEQCGDAMPLSAGRRLAPCKRRVERRGRCCAGESALSAALWRLDRHLR